MLAAMLEIFTFNCGVVDISKHYTHLIPICALSVTDNGHQTYIWIQMFCFRYVECLIMTVLCCVTVLCCMDKSDIFISLR